MILFLHGALDRVGGAERLRLTVCKALMQKPAEMRVCVLSNSGPLVDQLREIGVRVDCLNVENSIYSLRTRIALSRYLSDFRPSVVQTSQFNANVLARTMPALSSVIICEEHGMSGWKQWWHGAIDRVLSKRADCTIAVSRAVADYVSTHQGIPADRIEVLRNPVERWEPDAVDRLRLRDEHAIPRDALVIGHVGTLRTEKAQDILLEAFARVCSLHDLWLVMVGDGPLRAALKESSRKLGIQHRIVWAGEQADVRPWLSVMDLFAFPSRSEGLGIALLEAMSIGLPVIGSRAGGIPEIIEHEKTGLLVKPDNVEELVACIGRLSADTSLRAQLGNAGRAYVLAEHSASRYAERLLVLHQRLKRQAAA